MKINTKKFLLSVLSSSIFSLPILAGAADNAVTITGIVDNISIVIQYVAAAIVIILWILTGILFLSAQGDPTKLGTARKALFAAIGGTAIVILATTAAGIVSRAIFGGV